MRNRRPDSHPPERGPERGPECGPESRGPDSHRPDGHDGAQERHTPRPAAPVFKTTGPAGHRARMRERVLQTGAGGLADYEVLEMLLFAGVPRRDTKPLAKTLINQFGSLAAVIEAGPDRLKQARVPPGCVRLFATLGHIAQHVGHATRPERLALENWESVLVYCDVHLAGCAGQRHVLFLDSHNHLIADDELAPSPALDLPKPELAAVKQAVARLLQRALALHATSLMTVFLARDDEPVESALARDRVFATALSRAGALLGVGVHGHMVVGQGQWRSFSPGETTW